MKQHYALVNPLSRIVDKAREDFTREDLIRVIEEQQIERITFHYYPKADLPADDRLHETRKIMHKGLHRH